MSYNPFYYKWDFVKRRKLYFAISLGILVVGTIALLLFGLNLGIDFTSGSRVEVLIGQSFTDEEITDMLADINLAPDSLERVGEGENLTAVLYYKGALTNEQFEAIHKAFTAKYGEKVSLSESTVSPTIGRELARKTFYAILWASLGIILYVSIRFEYRFAITAIVALLHDVFVVLAAFSILRIQVDLTFIAAILTIVGYSVNDTIVTYDRIRENMKRRKIKTVADLENLVNDSIKQTLVRSVNTVLMVFAGTVALLIFGGPGVRNFSLALLFGLLSGTYSSLFIASQLWVVWKARELKKKGIRTVQPES